MGSISVKYNKKPSVVEAFKMDLSLPIIDFNVEHVENKEYAIYSACKFKDQVVAVIGLIRYDYLNKEVFIKIMDETIGPHYYDMKKNVFNQLTPIKQKSYANEWRKKVQSNFN
tara:strand:+ start:352 stop:690 length:339 start_codon:yes stop_codon:yes gene_type:complete